MTYAEDPFRRKLEKIDGKVTMTGEVSLDVGNCRGMAFQTRPNHQIGAAESPQSHIFSIGSRIRLQLAPNWRPSGKNR